RWINLFIFILLLLGQTKQALAQGQKGAISGLVTDDSGAVLKGAQVTLETPVFTTVSDEQGRVYINDVAAGSCRLTISYVDFTKLNEQVNITAGQIANMETKLKLQ